MLRSELSALGFRPSRRLGQNFLVDDACAAAIARDADLPEGDFVLEVGPGCGSLTRHLVPCAGRILAVEIDRRLFELASRLLADATAIEWLCTDILAGKHALSPEVDARLPRDAPWHLVSNLPYSVAGPLLAVLALREEPPSTATALVQLEVGERLAASPGSSAWGPLSAVVQTGFEVRLGRRLGPELFWPRPQIDSVVVHLARRSDLRPVADRARFEHLVGALFRHRRQTLGRVLGRILGERDKALTTLQDLGLEAGERAEVLPQSALWALVDAVEV